MSEIRIKAEEISINEKGEVVISNPALAEAVKEQLAGTRGGGEGGKQGLLDFNWGCHSPK